VVNIAGRLKRTEDLLRKLVPSEEDEKMFFVRMDPGVPTDAETKWYQEHPDFRGKIYVVTFGRQKLGQCGE
jgi:hypothetical protein